MALYVTYYCNISFHVVFNTGCCIILVLIFCFCFLSDYVTIEKGPSYNTYNICKYIACSERYSFVATRYMREYST